MKLLREFINKKAPRILPKQQYPGDCGLDLYVSKGKLLLPGTWADIPTNFRMQLPDGVWGLIVGRSSTFRKRGLLVIPGIIDHGYRGEIFAGVYNTTANNVWVSAGDRLAQLILMPGAGVMLTVEERAVARDSERGSSGFGSTGQ